MALAQPKLGRVVYGQGSIDPFFAAGYVALKRGYFGEAGLEVEYLNSQSGPRAISCWPPAESCSAPPPPPPRPR